MTKNSTPMWWYLLLILPAAALVAEDFRTREVRLVWLAALGVAAVAVGWIGTGGRTMLLHTACNAGILLVFGGTTVLWQVARRRSMRKLFSDYFGAGDAVAMLAVTPLFEPRTYIYFLLAACVAALIWWLVRRPPTLPFVGFIALEIGVYAICKVIWM